MNPFPLRTPRAPHTAAEHHARVAERRSSKPPVCVVRAGTVAGQLEGDRVRAARNFAWYYAAGAALRVRVLRDSVDQDGYRTVCMECVEVQSRGAFADTMQPGRQFDASCLAGFEGMIGWTLEYEL